MARKKKEEIKKEGDEIKWKVPEYTGYEKNKKWFIVASIAGVLLLIYSLFTANFLFAVIVIIIAIVIILRQGEKVNMLDFVITDDGIGVGRDFYDYDMIRNFAIVYKPKEETKNLYFEFKSFVRPRLSVPLEKMNPLLIRKNLLKYLEEDLERTDIPLSEQLSRLLRL